MFASPYVCLMMTDYNNEAFVLRAANQASIEPWPLPSEPGPNEVLCKTLAVGICGSDIHYLKEGRCASFIVKEPLVLGHETAAEIVRVGSAVTELKPGDRVAVEPTVPCENCEWCLSDQYNLCPDVSCHATPPIHGTLQRYFLHPAKYCFKVPDNVKVDEMATIEPLAVAVHACRRIPIKKGESTVLITGGGPIGLLVLQVAKAFGAKRCVVTEINEYRLNLAKEMGADETLLFTRETTESEMIEQIKKAFQGNFPDISMECSGVGCNFRVVMLSTKPGGTCMLVGMGPSEFQLPIATAAQREIKILGCFRYQKCFPPAINLLASGQVNVTKMISHRFDFEDTLKAFETAASGAGIKVIIKLISN